MAVYKCSLQILTTFVITFVNFVKIYPSFTNVLGNNCNLYKCDINLSYSNFYDIVTSSNSVYLPV